MRRAIRIGSLLLATASLCNAVQEACAAQAPAQAAVAPWAGMVIGSIVGRGGGDRFNPSNAARMPQSAYELAAVIDYQSEGLSARLRASAVERHIAQAAGDPHTHATRLDLTQLSWQHALTTHWSLSLGRMNLGFDEGQSYHPLDFFEDTVRGADFEDRAGRNRGFPLMMLERTTSQGVLRWIYSDDSITRRDYVYGDANPNFNRGLRQLVVSWRQSQGLLTWTTLLQRAWPGHTGLGAAFSWVPSMAGSIYAAAFLAPGNPWPVHRSVTDRRGMDLDARDVYTDLSPMGRWQADDHRWRLRALVGGQYTTESGHTIQLEVWRDGRGMDGEELNLWRRLREFHDRLGSPSARKANLAYDMSALRGPSGTHLFGRHIQPLPSGGALQGSVLLAQDRSGTAGLRWQGPNRLGSDLSLEVWRRFGAQDSLYRAFPDRQGVSLLWRSFF